MTPRLTEHARQRCEEMGIKTERVKRVVQDPTLSYASKHGYCVVCRTDEPAFRVVIDKRPEETVVITVIWWTSERYERSA